MGIDASKEQPVKSTKPTTPTIPTANRSQFFWHVDGVIRTLSLRVSLDEIYRYPTIGWNRRSLSRNQAVTIKFIDWFDAIVPRRDDGSDGWDWDALYLRLSDDDIRDHPDRPWSPELAIAVDKFQTQGKLPGFADPLIISKAITRRADPTHLIRHNYVWSGKYLGRNRRLRLWEVNAIFPTIRNLNFEIFDLNVHRLIDLVDVHDNPTVSWNLNVLSANSHITFRFVVDHLDVFTNARNSWNWESIIQVDPGMVGCQEDELPGSYRLYVAGRPTSVKRLMSDLFNGLRLGVSSVWDIWIRDHDFLLQCYDRRRYFCPASGYDDITIVTAA
jgi:hypothetical protein